MAATTERKIVVHIATSADGYIARTDGGLDWLTERPAPKGFYGMPQFMRSVDATILGRKTFDASIRLGMKFRRNDGHHVFSRCPPADRAGANFVTEPIRDFVARLKSAGGKTVWLMGGGGYARRSRFPDGVVQNHYEVASG